MKSLRFSLLNLLLIMAVVALGVTAWNLNRQLVPLRDEVRRLRSELGMLMIDDPTKVYLVQVPHSVTREWKYRVYIPENRQIKVDVRTGSHPLPSGSRTKQLAEIRNRTSGTSGGLPSGEYTLTIALNREITGSDEMWKLTLLRTGGGYQSSMNFGMAELADTRRWGFTQSDVSYEPKPFELNEPVQLLLMRQNDLKEMQGGYSTTEAQGPAPGISVWVSP